MIVDSEYLIRNFEEYMVVTKNPIAAALLVATERLNNDLHNIHETMDHCAGFHANKLGDAIKEASPDHNLELRYVSDALNRIAEAIDDTREED